MEVYFNIILPVADATNGSEREKLWATYFSDQYFARPEKLRKREHVLHHSSLYKLHKPYAAFGVVMLNVKC